MNICDLLYLPWYTMRWILLKFWFWLHFHSKEPWSDIRKIEQMAGPRFKIKHLLTPSESNKLGSFYQKMKDLQSSSSSDPTQSHQVREDVRKLELEKNGRWLWNQILKPKMAQYNKDWSWFEATWRGTFAMCTPNLTLFLTPMTAEGIRTKNGTLWQMVGSTDCVQLVKKRRALSFFTKFYYEAHFMPQCQMTLLSERRFGKIRHFGHLDSGFWPVQGYSEGGTDSSLIAITPSVDEHLILHWVNMAVEIFVGILIGISVFIPWNAQLELTHCPF